VKVVAFVNSHKKNVCTSLIIQRHCMYNLADYQKPLEYLFVLEFSRTALGKTLNRKLIEQYQEGLHR
jgi:hypothetical protein